MLIDDEWRRRACARNRLHFHGVVVLDRVVARGVIGRAADIRQRVEVRVRQDAGVADLNVVVVKNTMSPATAGNAVTFSSLVVEFATAVNE